MGIPLLRAVTKYYDLVDTAAIDPGIIIPSELNSYQEYETILSRRSGS